MDNSLEYKWLTTLLYSWGSDTPQEVIWGINEMVQWLNEKHGFELEELYEPYSSEAEDPDYNEGERVASIVEALKTLSK